MSSTQLAIKQLRKACRYHAPERLAIKTKPAKHRGHPCVKFIWRDPISGETGPIATSYSDPEIIATAAALLDEIEAIRNERSQHAESQDRRGGLDRADHPQHASGRAKAAGA